MWRCSNSADIHHQCLLHPSAHPAPASLPHPSQCQQGSPSPWGWQRRWLSPHPSHLHWAADPQQHGSGKREMFFPVLCVTSPSPALSSGQFCGSEPGPSSLSGQSRAEVQATEDARPDLGQHRDALALDLLGVFSSSTSSPVF